MRLFHSKEKIEEKDPHRIFDTASEKVEMLNDRIEAAIEPTRERIHDLIEDVKPRLRGWFHLGTVPLVLIAGLALTVLAPTQTARLGAAVFTFTSVVLFTMSAVYHRGNGWWDRRTHLFLRKVDHANIYLLIGGSVTPFALLLLEGKPRILLLSLMWGGVLVGIVLKILWTKMPRKISTLFYALLGWLPVLFISEFAKGINALLPKGEFVVIALIVAGGALYTIGGIVYGFKRPNPWPKVLGFHELFHFFTILAFICHYAAVSIVSYSAR